MGRRMSIEDEIIKLSLATGVPLYTVKGIYLSARTRGLEDGARAEREFWLKLARSRSAQYVTTEELVDADAIKEKVHNG